MSDITPAMFDADTSPEALAAWAVYSSIDENPIAAHLSPFDREQDALTAGFDAAKGVAFATGGQIDPGAASAVLWFFGHPAGRAPGRFTELLLDAMACADESNRARLVAAFPHFGWPFLMAKSARNGVQDLYALVEKVPA
jgi:hypothetical protein